MSKVNECIFTGCCEQNFLCCFPIYLAVIMEKLFHCYLHIRVDGFVFKNGCTVDTFPVYTIHQVLWALKNAKSRLETAIVAGNWRSLTLMKWFGIIICYGDCQKGKTSLTGVFYRRESRKSPNGRNTGKKTTEQRGSHERFVFTCGTSPNSVQENLLPKVLGPKIKPDDSKKKMLILSWKPRGRKVDSLGWRTLLGRESMYVCLLLFSDLCIFADT